MSCSKFCACSTLMNMQLTTITPQEATLQGRDSRNFPNCVRLTPHHGELSVSPMSLTEPEELRSLNIIVRLQASVKWLNLEVVEARSLQALLRLEKTEGRATPLREALSWEKQLSALSFDCRRSDAASSWLDAVQAESATTSVMAEVYRLRTSELASDAYAGSAGAPAAEAADIL
mmetsp:Transcript_77851/g.231949  ORF Transcript_77851/g.231949 Transcript_77851/m.231949 type:complete len:175 (-) Transcript_77851:224-748(-)